MGNQKTDLIDDAILRYLESIGSSWSEFDKSKRPASDRKALFLLASSGLVAEKVFVEVRAIGRTGGLCFETSINGRASEDGIHREMQKHIPMDWRIDEAGNPMHVTLQYFPTAFRLTAEGEQAAHDVKNEHEDAVLDWVRLRGQRAGEMHPYLTFTVFDSKLVEESTEPDRDGGPANLDLNHYSTPDNPSQWAKKFGITPKTLRRWRNNNLIRVHELTSKSIRIHLEDVEKFTKKKEGD